MARRVTDPPESSPRLLERALAECVPAEQRSMVIGEALRNAGMLAIPSEGSAFQAFVRGPLRLAANMVAGGDAGDRLVDALLGETDHVGDAPTLRPPRRESP